MKNKLPQGVELLAMSIFRGDKGQIAVAEEGAEVPFQIKRVFVVHETDKNTERGQHAHKTCTQLMICLAGEVEITLTDGESRQTVTLSSPAQGLKVPPLIWSSQRYPETGSMLMVICDETYAEEEYIRDYDEFTAYGERG